MLAAMLAASCSPKVYPVQRDTVTQVRTEIVERLVRDTVEVTLPQDSVHVQTRDTMSVLRIKTAISEASVSGGVLSHTLYSNPAYKPEIEVVYKDRVPRHDHLREQHRGHRGGAGTQRLAESHDVRRLYPARSGGIACRIRDS